MSHRPTMVTIGPTLTPAVKGLILANAAVFLLQLAAGSEMISIFGLTPALVIQKFFIWQLVTYLFLHGGIGHIVFNMFGLWMFGPELERLMGRDRFLRFYFVSGVGAGLLSMVFAPQSTTIGASGAIYGILMAYGMIFPNRLVYLYFLFPVKVKYFVAVLGALAFWSALGSPGSTVAHVAHLGGMLFGFLEIKGWLSVGRWRQVWYRWRVDRMRQKFRVYDNRPPRPPKDDHWIN